ncbi:hydroxymethylbilane synthase [Mycetocola manganoxydans]|uniref:Porphobilinogen deaminase n=1 Tax=Mycetocola manganoxydans TaxID=699879 RepID=A0A3L6ZWE5_9MICO|nr:hydroxymethylbilane synthase [Mycetocola manganoxydans]RLP71432.1 hydroxymethylbilane synthase [Mycetocola manganoxydans]GHD46476.1 porphobilinogen deaminase 1 [Mycetocola manganoxydans]
MTLSIGTRGSALAMAQTGDIARAITAATGVETELVPVTTHGDISRESLSSLGGTGVFASALREFLLRGECDLVVHSMKDLPTAAYAGLRVGAVPERADARDVLCARDGLTLSTLPDGARVGTGSPRRAAQLAAVRPDLTVLDIRGNVETRLGFVTSGELDAVVLAAAGLGRLGRLDAVTDYFELDDWPTAPAQGALAIEVRTAIFDDPARFGDILRALDEIEHPDTRTAVTAERAILSRLEAGCAAPIGATAVVTPEHVRLTGAVYAPDGSGTLRLTRTADFAAATRHENTATAETVGSTLADELLAQGAATLAPIRQN